MNVAGRREFSRVVLVKPPKIATGTHASLVNFAKDGVLTCARGGRDGQDCVLFDILSVGVEHRAEVLEFVGILQGLAIKLGGLALLMRDEC